MGGVIFSDSALLPLTVLAVRVDDTPQLVHNLEIGGAHTYFAGELDAWAHNAGVYGWFFNLPKQYWGRTFGENTCTRANVSKRIRSNENGRPPTSGLSWNASSNQEAAIWERYLIRQALDGGCSLNNRNMPGIPRNK